MVASLRPNLDSLKQREEWLALHPNILAPESQNGVAVDAINIAPRIRQPIGKGRNAREVDLYYVPTLEANLRRLAACPTFHHRRTEVYRINAEDRHWQSVCVVPLTCAHGCSAL